MAAPAPGDAAILDLYCSGDTASVAELGVVTALLGDAGLCGTGDSDARSR